MSIQEENIVFVESQVMDDVPEGGGAATGIEIIDGKMNNVFPDISDLDRGLGRFQMRKLFLAVRSANADLYGGAKSVITDLPVDPALGYTLFTTNDAFDRRADAADRIEAFLFKGPSWPGVLYENHISGMQAINVLQRVDTALPPIGKTLCIVQDYGLPSEREQYVRVIDVDVTLTTFTDQQGDYDRWVVTMSLSDPLVHDFDGHSANRFDNYDFDASARIRDTTLADAARYFGSQRLAESAAIGDTLVRAQSQFTQLVPSARSESPLVNQFLNPDLVQQINAGTRDVEVPQQAHTLALDVTPENRRLNWVTTLDPRPASGTLSIAFMSQGNWYVLTDDGTGVLAGSDPSIGAGTVNLTTGSTSVTLGSFPDAGSQIMYIWASPVHYSARANDPAIDPNVVVEFEAGEAVQPGTMTITWEVDSVTKTATVSSAGEISGDATGYFSHVSGQGRIEFPVPPDSTSLLGLDYERVTEVHATFTSVSESGGLATINLGQAVEPGTVRAEWSTESTVRADQTRTRRIWRKIGGQWSHIEVSRSAQSERVTRLDHESTDDGLGEIVNATGGVNYGTGQLVLPVLPAFEQLGWSVQSQTWESSVSNNHQFSSGVVEVWFVPAGAPTTVVSKTISMPPITFRVLPRLLDGFGVPNSIEFEWNGETYQDANGTLLRSGNVVAGSMDYTAGIATLDDYVTGPGSITVTSLLVRFGDWLTTESSFRASSSPLAPESVQIIAIAEDGEQLTGLADENGDLVSSNMRGSVNYEFGVGQVEFGAMGPDPEDPGGPDIWIPRRVDPGTITYNAIAYSYVPLPSDIVGINAVRLPPDGRVPIYRPGDVVMVMHPVTNAPASPVQDGGAGPYLLDVGRTRIAWVRITDANGDAVNEGFELDRAAGVLSWDDIAGLALPLTVKHTVADLRLVTDAQISGELTISRPLSHPFPAEESIVGSCLLHGDRRARVSQTFDQHSWDGTWSDSPSGPEATATLNLIDFPIEVTNEGCDTDNWLLRCVNSSSNQWELISRNRGLVWSGTYLPGGSDIAPINPRTRVWDEGSQTWVGGVPYLRIPGAANGGGWSSGNVVRIDTVGAIVDMWVARSIQQSEEPAGDGIDGMEMYALGNVNNPVGE
jgi:hypothetical protein